MFKQRKEEDPQGPRLQGEDFDIYPDLGDRPAPSAPIEAPADEPEDDPPPTELQQKIAAIPEEKWKTYQLLAGIFLGLVCGVLITFGNVLFDGSVGVIIAFGIAVVLPNILERQIARTTRRMRIVMAASLAVWLVISVIYGALNPGFLSGQ